MPARRPPRRRRPPPGRRRDWSSSPRRSRATVTSPERASTTRSWSPLSSTISNGLRPRSATCGAGFSVMMSAAVPPSGSSRGATRMRPSTSTTATERPSPRGRTASGSVYPPNADSAPSRSRTVCRSASAPTYQIRLRGSSKTTTPAVRAGAVIGIASMPNPPDGTDAGTSRLQPGRGIPRPPDTRARSRPRRACGR